MTTTTSWTEPSIERHLLTLQRQRAQLLRLDGKHAQSQQTINLLARNLSQSSQKTTALEGTVQILEGRVAILESARQRMQDHVCRLEVRISKAVMFLKVAGCLLFTLTACGAVYAIAQTLQDH